MSRMIDADALMKDLEKWMKQVDPTHPQEDNAIPPMEDIIVSTLMTIEEQPTIEERKKGKWNFIGDQMFECTECGTCYTQSQFYQMRVRISDTEFPKFCPNCGARMVVEHE